MATSFAVTVVSADKSLFEGNAKMIAATAINGEIGILAGHTPFIATLKAGQVRITLEDNTEEVIYVSGGVLEAQPAQVIILADSADRADSLSIEKIEQAKARAQELRNNSSLGSPDYKRAQDELIQAQAQMAALRRLRK